MFLFNRVIGVISFDHVSVNPITSCFRLNIEQNSKIVVFFVCFFSISPDELFYIVRKFFLKYSLRNFISYDVRYIAVSGNILVVCFKGCIIFSQPLKTESDKKQLQSQLSFAIFRLAVQYFQNVIVI